MRQHSYLYSRVERTQLLYNFNFVWVLYYCDFHTGLSILKAFLVLPTLLLLLLVCILTLILVHKCRIKSPYINRCMFSFHFM